MNDPPIRRRRPRQSGSARSAMLLPLLFRFQDAAVPLALLGLTALAIGVYVPSIARLEAMAGLLLLAPVALWASVRWARDEAPGLRRAARGLAALAGLLALAVVGRAMFPGTPLARASLAPSAVMTVPVAADLERFELSIDATLHGAAGGAELSLERAGDPVRVGVPFTWPASAEAESGVGQRVHRRVGDVAVPGEGPLRVRLVAATEAVSAPIDVSLREASLLDRHLLPVAALLGSLAIATQIYAGRRRARSWLLLGVGVALGQALYAPGALDPADPSLLGIAAVALLGGGGAGLALTYVIGVAQERQA